MCHAHGSSTICWPGAASAALSLVKIRLNEAKNADIFDDLEPDQQQMLSMLATAEGVTDLPLWRAAAMNAAIGHASATAH